MGNRPRLLVVEDNENKRWLLGHYLSKTISTADCVLCSSGEEAIHHLSHHTVDAIVTDHSMEPINGLELIKWVRGHLAALPIIMVTGHTWIEREAMDAGANLVLNTLRFSEVGELLLPMLSKPEQA
jgi:CheY-like chemotaxis protein